MGVNGGIPHGRSFPVLAIIAKGSGWQSAPYDIETWGVTQVLLKRPVDLVIDMNVYADNRWGEKEKQDNREVIHRCSKKNIPYIGLDNYPIDDVVSFFKTNYFTNTIDYAIALALYRNFKTIHLYGVNMKLESEYAYQKPGVDFWCGYALGMGKNIIAHKSTAMRSKTGLMYGYEVSDVGNI